MKQSKYKVKYEVQPEGYSYILIKVTSLTQAMLLAEQSFDKQINILSVEKL